MRLYLDLATLSLIAGPNDRRVISQIQAKRGDALPMEIQFLRNGQPERLPASTVVTFGAKPLNQFDASPVVLDATFVQSAAPGGEAFDDAKWTSAPSLNTTALNSLFFIDGDSSNDPQFVDLSAEITWQADSDIGPTTIRTFVFRVLNDVIRGDEGTPTSIPGPGEWLSARTARYDIEQNLSQLQRVQIQRNIGVYSPFFNRFQAAVGTPLERTLKLPAVSNYNIVIQLKQLTDTFPLTEEIRLAVNGTFGEFSVSEGATGELSLTWERNAVTSIGAVTYASTNQMDAIVIIECFATDEIQIAALDDDLFGVELLDFEITIFDNSPFS